MILVPKNVLQELASSSINENDNNEFSYDDFKTEYENTLKQNKNSVPSSMRLHEYIYELIQNSYLKRHSPPIKFINEGSSRAAFACVGGKCLKIAINQKGIAQNTQEVKNLANAQQKYQCFTHLYDWDMNNFASLMSECCSKISMNDFQKAFNVDMKTFEKAMEMASQVSFNLETIRLAIQHAESMISSGQNFPLKVQFLKNLLEKDDMQWKVMRDLFKFYTDNSPDDLIFEDICEIDNWGLGIREGKIVPIILDAGFSEDVYQDFYL